MKSCLPAIHPNQTRGRIQRCCSRTAHHYAYSFVHPFVCMSIRSSFCSSVRLVFTPVRSSVCPSVSLYAHRFVCPSVRLSVHNISAFHSLVGGPFEFTVDMMVSWRVSPPPPPIRPRSTELQHDNCLEFIQCYKYPTGSIAMLINSCIRWCSKICISRLGLVSNWYELCNRNVDLDIAVRESIIPAVFVHLNKYVQIRTAAVIHP